MGRIQAIFKADGGESDNRYSIAAEWWFNRSRLALVLTLTRTSSMFWREQ